MGDNPGKIVMSNCEELIESLGQHVDTLIAQLSGGEGIDEAALSHVKICLKQLAGIYEHEKSIPKSLARVIVDLPAAISDLSFIYDDSVSATIQREAIELATLIQEIVTSGHNT